MPGDGSVTSKLLIVGEAPGSNEDTEGHPFVGKAGQLLSKLLESVGLYRSEVFVTNLIKCRPPQNREPLPEEVELCNPYLLAQIDFINPKVILSLGKHSTQFLLNSTERISGLRGKSYEVRLNGKLRTVVPSFHPAYILRNPTAMSIAYDDFFKVMSKLNEV